MANSVNPDQTAPIGAVCSGSTLFASILNTSVMLGNYLQQTTSADDIFRCIFFLGALRANISFENTKRQEFEILECLLYRVSIILSYSSTKMHLGTLKNCLTEMDLLSTQSNV